ncbi:hypothetical protein EVAR_25167_1 [Eumeta japonica]|uniref:Histone-lysine N-methyltransferase SETMAR n=1 Tax=Eumeta variegata TaxID=151549 RepID=A0A4C1VSZ8_EUMVA|nr:hypothetical protein EVAR_25167_1 [Eumeta japonica]
MPRVGAPRRRAGLRGLSPPLRLVQTFLVETRHRAFNLKPTSKHREPSQHFWCATVHNGCAMDILRANVAPYSRVTRWCNEIKRKNGLASTLRSAVVMAAILDLDFEILNHFPYSPDLALCDFCLSPKFKEYLEEKRIKDDEAVVAGV